MNEDDIQQIFFVECEEALEATESGLDACKLGTHDDETINAIFRGVHSIKGGAGAFGHGALASYTHTFENLLGEIREGQVELESKLVDLLLIALDMLRDHVDAARDGGEVPDDAKLIEQLEAARAGGAGIDAAPDEGTPAEAPAETAPEVAADIGDDLDALLDELSADAPAEAPDETEAASAPEPSWLVHIRRSLTTHRFPISAMVNRLPSTKGHLTRMATPSATPSEIVSTTRTRS